MATLKLAIVPAKQAKDGTHKIRVALGHKKETRYIVTRFKVDNLSCLKDGQVVGCADASVVNVKLRNIHKLDILFLDIINEMLLVGYHTL